MKKLFLQILKMLFVVAAFYYLLRDIDISQLISQFLSIDYNYIFIALFVYITLFYMFAYRWDLMNHIFDIRIPVKKLFKDHMIGFFFSNFLPSTIGGDVWRIKQLLPFTERKKTKAFVIVMLERIAGFVATFLLGIVSLIYFRQNIHNDKFELVTIGLTLFFLLIVIALFIPTFYDWQIRFYRKIKLQTLQDKLIQMAETMKNIPAYKIKFIVAVLISFATIFTYALTCYFIAQSFSTHFSYLHISMIIPIIYIATMIPISINGLGIREGIFIKLLMVGGATKIESTGIAFMITFAQLFISILGGIFYAIDKKHISQQH